MAEPLLTPRRWSIQRPFAPWAPALCFVLFSSALFIYFELRSLGHFRTAWVAAHRGNDTASLEALICWDEVSAEERQRMRLLLAQELEHPVRTAEVQLDFRASAQPGWHPNRFVVARLTVTFDTPERLMVSFPVGLDGFLGHRVAMMVREK